MTRNRDDSHTWLFGSLYSGQCRVIVCLRRDTRLQQDILRTNGYREVDAENVSCDVENAEQVHPLPPQKQDIKAKQSTCEHSSCL